MKDKFLNIMGDIDQKYIEEYERIRRAKKRSLFIRIAAAAACLCVVAGSIAIPLLTHREQPPVILQGTEGTVSSTVTPTEPTPTEPAKPTEPSGPVEPPEPNGPFSMLDISAEKTEGQFIKADTDFIIETENGSEKRVREHLYISGGPDYAVTKIEGEKYRVSLKGNLSAGSTVSLSYAKDGATEYSWAFETERKLEVVSTSPYKSSTNVKKTAPIVLELSMAGSESIAPYVTVTPEIEGRWEQVGNVHRLIPDYPLAEDTEYTVNVATGYTVDGYTMEEYHFSFNTGNRSISIGPSPNYRGMLYFRTVEDVMLMRHKSTNRTESESVVRIYDFGSAEAMIAYLEGDDSILDAPFTTPSFTVKEMNDYTQDFNIGRLPAGYYLAEIETEGAYTPILRNPVCVHPNAVYAAITERDLVIWADDKDIPVSMGGHTAKTNENGIAYLKDVADGSFTAGYVYLGDEALPLVFAVPQYEHNVYPSCYLYCDKPIYKTDDTVRYFGVVPAGLFWDGCDEAFTLTVEKSGGILRTLSVTPDEDGCFSGEFSYADLSEGYTYLRLTYDGQYLAGRGIEIEDYYLENYLYEINTEKKYVTVGSTFDFTVKVEHISGVKVSGKKLCAKVDGTRYYATTNDSGIAHFSIPAPEDDITHYGGNVSQLESETVTLYGGDPEEGDSAYDGVSYIYYWIVREDADITYKMVYDGEYTAGDVFFRGVYLRPEKVDNTSYVNREDFYEYGAPFDACLTVTLTTKRRQRTGSHVNSDTGSVVYEYESLPSTTEEVAVINVEDVNEYILRRSDYDLPDPDEFTCYSLEFSITFNLGEGNIDRNSSYIKDNDFVNVSKTDRIPHNNIGISSSYHGSMDGFGSNEAGTYRYMIKGNDSSYRVGEEVPLYIFDTVKDERVTEGVLLRIIYRNGVLSTDLVDVNDAAFTYEAEYGPYVCVTYAYHMNGRFYRIPDCRVMQERAERTITVTQETDKESYAPGEEITVTVRTTNEAGEGVPCTVNISVVNEAVFAEREHGTYIMNVLSPKNHPLYAFSSYFDRDLRLYAGGMGDGGGYDPRVNFADTALFHTVKTDENGVATVTFTLPDSVTEYRITTHAASGEMMYGTAVSKFKVKLDFFMSTTAPRGQKHTDDFVAYVTTVGKSGEAEFTFSLKETGQVIKTTAPVGSAATANFGKLPVGRYTLCVQTKSGEYSDAIEYPIEVTPGAMTNSYSEQLTDSTPITVTPSSFPAKIEIYTHQRAKYLSYFSRLSSAARTRLDYAICAHAGDRLYNDLMGTEEPESYYSVNRDFISGDLNLYSMYAEGGGDYILTALARYFSSFKQNIYHDTPQSPDVYIRQNLLKASGGTASLCDLRATEQYGEDDEQLMAMIALSYAFMGDYDSAARLYATLPERSDILGVDGMRAILSTFIDRESAAAIIDTLLAEEPDEYYLNFAILSYLKNRVDSMAEERTVTLTVNGNTERYTVSDLVMQTVYLENDGSGQLSAVYSCPKDVCVSITYVDYERMTGTGDFQISIEGSPYKNEIAYLVIDTKALYGSKSIIAALPPALRMCGSLSSEAGVYGYAKHENLSIHTNKEHSGTIRVPLLVTQSGSYTIEPLRLTDVDGNVHYSNELSFTVE